MPTDFGLRTEWGPIHDRAAFCSVVFVFIFDGLYSLDYFNVVCFLSFFIQSSYMIFVKGIITVHDEKQICQTLIMRDNNTYYYLIIMIAINKYNVFFTKIRPKKVPALLIDLGIPSIIFCMLPEGIL